MAKNNKLINSLAAVARRNREQNIMEASRRDTPQIYAALAIALWMNLDETDEEKTRAINVIFGDSQKVWYECIEKGVDVVDYCEELTGTSVRMEEQDET